MTVAIAASTAFTTPVASTVNTLVLGPGGYRFNDFIKVGVPLQLTIMILILLVVRLVFPLNYAALKNIDMRWAEPTLQYIYFCSVRN